MFSTNYLKRIMFLVSLMLFVLLLPTLPGTFSGLDDQTPAMMEMVQPDIGEFIQPGQKEAVDPEPDQKLPGTGELELNPSELEKIAEKADSKPDPAFESGFRLLNTLTEKSKSEFTASFSKDQKMMRDFAASAEKMATVILNPAAIVTGVFSPGNRIIVEVSEDNYYLVTVEETSRNLGVDIVRGRVEESHFGFFHMTTSEGQTRVVLRVPEKNKVYHIAYSNAGRYHLFEFNIDEFERYEDESLPPRIPEEKRSDTLAEVEVFEHAFSDPLPGTAGSPRPEDPAQIDVMVVYTPAARDWAGGIAHINNEIHQAMLRSQEALTNSNTGITLRLVHTVMVSYSEISISRSLDDITNGLVGNVHALRNTHGADLVTFFPNHNNRGGEAWIGWWNGYGQAEHGYSVACITGVASSYLVIHEMGHNFGAHHHKMQIHQPGPHRLYSYAAGWRFKVGSTWYNTVMSYSQGSQFPGGPGAGITSIEVGYFSNPLINYPGSSVPVGHTADGDNRRLLRNHKHGVAAFRQTAGSTPPRVVLKSPANDVNEAGTSVVFQWNTAARATKYQLQIRRATDNSVFKNQTLSNVTQRVIQDFPANGVQYKWRIRAGNAAGWGPWSAYRNFNNPFGAFNHNFNATNDYQGWIRRPQAVWSLNSKAMLTAGQANRWVSARRGNVNYQNLDYSVRMRRTSSQLSGSGIVIRAGGKYLSNGDWYPSYQFLYRNNGTYSIWRVNPDGADQALQDWTASTHINKNGWNTLRVLAVNNNLRFFINGNLVRIINDSNLRRGLVGVMAYRSSSDPSSTSLLVDRARLSRPVAGSAASMETVDHEQQALNEADQTEMAAGRVNLKEEHGFIQSE